MSYRVLVLSPEEYGILGAMIQTSSVPVTQMQNAGAMVQKYNEAPEPSTDDVARILDIIMPAPSSEEK